ncbi:hypothetical protein PGH45_12975 [Legionella pneumophila]|nr:hypothetical protein [Legionella pneumophila]
MDYRIIPIFESPARQQKGTKQGGEVLLLSSPANAALCLIGKEEKIDSVARSGSCPCINAPKSRVKIPKIEAPFKTA